MMSGFDLLLEKLESFIRKYYKNLLLKGVIYSAALLFTFFLAVLIMDYLGQFNTLGRTVLFYFYIGIAGVVLINYLIRPLLKLNKLGSRLSYEQASLIVGNHFTELKDRVLNTLQLYHSRNDVDPQQMQLISASIDQRIQSIKPIEFTSAIDLSENKKYLKYLLIPLIIFLSIYLWDSKIITIGTDRFINHSEYIAPSTPFTFNVKSENLSVVENEDFHLDVEVQGNQVPSNVYVVVDGRKQKMNKNSNREFSFDFRNVSKTTVFFLTASDVESQEMELEVVPKPSLLNFVAEIEYPKYTGLDSQKIENIGDISIPEGSKVRWLFSTINTNKLHLSMNDSIIHLIPIKDNSFEFTQTLFESSNYILSQENDYLVNPDSLQYSILIQKDQYPTIQVETKKDSSNPFVTYFSGNIKDDYGFSNLSFTYSIQPIEGNTTKKSQSLPISKAFNQDQFFHFFDISTLDLNPGDKVSYFFTVWDNDGVNGPKSGRTQQIIYQAPTKAELSDQADANNKEIKDAIDKSIDDANKLQKDIEDFKKELYEKQNTDWQDKNKLENIINQQQALENQLEKLNQLNESTNKEQNQFSEKDQELLDKQQQLQELMDKLMTPELKKLYDELQKLMEEMNKNQLLNKMDEIEMSQEQMEKEMDRALEQFKQLEFEEKLKDVTQRMDELAEKQEKLSEETKNKEKSNFDLNKEQEKIKNEFDELKKEMEDLEQLNQELDKKHNMKDHQEDQQEISDEMKESSEQLADKKNKKASESQKNAAEKMQEMSNEMKNMLAKDQEEQQGEDMNALRQLLENLVQFSFDQENLMHELSNTNTKDPKYVELGQQQFKLQDDAKLIEDSLYALSKRVMQLSPYINKEVLEINKNISAALKHIEERQTPMANSKQQYVMTATNKLALLFEEALKQMQAQAKNSKPGSGSCSKPGGNSPKPSSTPSQSLQQLQKSLEEQLKKMQQQMEKGQQEGGKKDGQKGDGSTPSNNGQPKSGGMGSKQIAEMAAQQMALRKKLEQLAQEMNKDGSGRGNGLKEIAKEIEEVEDDIINQTITPETLHRQKDILSRLLEHEKAEREREYDNKRKSNEAKNQEISNPKEFLEYKEKKEKELELLKTIPPSLKPYYKNKVNEYFNHIE